MGISFKMSWIVCYLEFKDVPSSVPGLVMLDICPKLSVGFWSGRLAQCTDVMLCHPFLDNRNSVG